MMRQSQLSTLFAFTLLCCLVSSTWASTYQLSHTFQPDDPENAPFFGSAVVLEDGVAAIKSNSGYVDQDGLSKTHIFEQGIDGSWNEAAVLSYDSGDDFGNPYIGQELAIDNGEIVISYALPYQDPSSSHLQFATKDASGWSVQFNEPTPDAPAPTPLRSSLPGRSVDISGDFTIANDPNQQTVRIYEKSGDGRWNESANISPNVDQGDRFVPFDIAIDDTTIVVANDWFSTQTSLYFFEYSSDGEWHVSNSFTYDHYRAFVDIDGDLAVVSDPVNNELYVYERLYGTWQESQSFQISGISKGIAIDNGVIAFNVMPRDNSSSFVNLLQKSEGTWGVSETIYDPNPEAEDLFGESLAFDEGRLLIGDWGGEQGVAYLFTQVPEPSAALLAMLASFIGGLQRRTR